MFLFRLVFFKSPARKFTVREAASLNFLDFFTVRRSGYFLNQDKK